MAIQLHKPFVLQTENCFSLGWGARIRGFIICFVVGIVLSLLVSRFVCEFWLTIPIGCRAHCSFGFPTLFLMGPLNQLKRMFEETRIFAAVIMLVFMILTICSVVLWKNKLLCLIFCICQSLSLTWYSLSYIPYAR
ncbi:unnamed protein product [Echinostoma caproni]|uniref:Vesicle transport protein n=1 Tax=Echinostoma caproni TaxID=27848 RepID=A0A3P8FH46_9TREM|nr:unnamed protein product [Echinostoma caproni]